MTTTDYSPLGDPEDDGGRWVPPLDFALDRARDTLAQQQAANIYDNRAMLGAAVHLEIALHDLLAALDKKAGQ
ncbi:hypothetical protein J7F03_28370 [Streptomyces sp. ISL-43]|uniref:hypothetical protein n=1 Tax=Streptomyces sp. ISL-43 TaxID=2819183 RepID=UPI001BE6AAA8|nr:hypothetical protein [Streptomyces sp. ISL-43]MBT2450920.1 hypothetical protein [Streptomyces sp. ISL-43]